MNERAFGTQNAARDGRRAPVYLDGSRSGASSVERVWTGGAGYPELALVGGSGGVHPVAVPDRPSRSGRDTGGGGAMSAVKTYLAGFGLVAFVGAVPGFLLPDAQSLAPIEVHELSIDVSSWTVTQDRTVAGDIDVPMNWTARIERVDTGETVYPCAGSGYFAYPTGRRAAPLPVGVWVGHESCTRDALDPGSSYQLHAAWWIEGASPVIATSAPFQVTP